MGLAGTSIGIVGAFPRVMVPDGSEQRVKVLARQNIFRFIVSSGEVRTM